ncbi:hypothetical protein AB0B04_18675 [Streptomyces xinghaiensis]|uniref:hypothetical protein n=1 Tax=Streptomyces TaxID=1883 RepID=UPI0007C811D9|nr:MULTISPECIES: hypothetical protein [Streptomyces]OFA48243.1 hypothetical protein BEN35_19055 [Streptomyces fradiae]
MENTRSAHGLASDPAHTPALAVSALDILVQLGIYMSELGWDSQKEEPATVMQTATADLRLHLLNAASHLSIATRLAPFPGHSTPTPLSHARTALTASKDLLATHRGPDQQPLTPYALLLAHAGPQHYLALRMTDVAWELGRLVGEAATAGGPPALCEELQAARRELVRAAVLGRAATREAAHETAFLLAAPATRPIPPAPDESPAHALTRLQDSSEQLLRISFDATRTSDLPRPSGSDWRQLARSLALTRLLSAQLLSHTGADAALRASLVQLARHWHAAAEAWHHIVDLTDPSARPLLPKYDLGLRRQGKASPLPQPSGPHPGCTIATHMAARTGRLLYGPGWQPMTAAAPAGPGPPRPSSQTPQASPPYYTPCTGCPWRATTWRLPPLFWLKPPPVRSSLAASSTGLSTCPPPCASTPPTTASSSSSPRSSARPPSLRTPCAHTWPITPVPQVHPSHA